MTLEVFTTATHGLPTKCGYEHLIDGWVVTPNNPGWFSPGMLGPVLIDNGAFGHNTRSAHEMWDQCAQLVGCYGDRARMVVLPDEVGCARTTLSMARLLLKTRPVTDCPIPVAYVLQPGFKLGSVEEMCVLAGIEWLFVGGPDFAWKRKAVETITGRGFKIHVGRVARMRELLHCYAHPEIVSVDNSTFSNGLNRDTAPDYINRLNTLRALANGEQRTLDMDDLPRSSDT